jgi:hypothetical protein
MSFIFEVTVRNTFIVEALQAVKVAYTLDPSDKRYRADYNFFLSILKDKSGDQCAPR